MKRTLLMLACLGTLGAARSFAAGMLIPKDASIPPLAIESQRVDIRIKDGVATAKIEQVFRNSVGRDLEAVFIFPLPANASISDFAMMINGKRMSGELVEKGKARGIYEDIVRRMKDPGLLEHIGGNLFRISVFPVPANGLQKIELEYSQTLAFDGGLYTYVYPLKTGERASRTLADFTVSVRLNSSLPIKSVYSPSHKVGITRKNDQEAVIGFEEDQALLDRDFVLYYTVSKKEFGLNMLTHAATNDKGFFMMMLAPSMAAPGAVMPKDVTFVIDTSGSMAGSKIEQTRKALEYGVKKLNAGDRFNIIRFSTDVEPFRPALTAVSETNRAAALAFIQATEARGGTAINDALAAALTMDYDPMRPAIILFLTDGRPTVGETAPDAILGSLGKGNGAKARIFVFGAGTDVNTHLLDQIAGQNGGLSQYVLPDEDIEVKVSALADKMSNPVLARVRVEVDTLKTSMVHPTALPDLFSGDQIIVFGRYEGGGDSVIRLIGEVNGKTREFVYEGTFPRAQADNTFIPRLWATRRVGFLLDEIRLRGENAELKDEVIRLSREYGIMTPYTSYLVLENEQAYAQHGIDRHKAEGRASGDDKTSGQPLYAADLKEVFLDGTPGSAAPPRSVVPLFEAPAADAVAIDVETRSAYEVSASRVHSRGGKMGVGGGASAMREESGAQAVAMSKRIQEYKERDSVRNEVATVKYVGKKVFTLLDGRWIDNAFKKEMKTVTVTFGSAEYFKLLTDKPELKDVLALGSKVTVVLEDGTALVVE
ncbi:MAG: VWA domain-containing protein [Lentisphaerae bacterium]|nr:VWA domain-containing protein [Lentisphaerota bacterium]